VLVEKHDLDGAEKLYKQSLEVEPGNAGAMSELEYIKSIRPK